MSCLRVVDCWYNQSLLCWRRATHDTDQKQKAVASLLGAPLDWNHAATHVSSHYAFRGHWHELQPNRQ